MTDLPDILGPTLVEAIERLVDERVEQRLREWNGDAVAQWLTIEEAAAHARVSQRTLQRQLAKGRVRSATVGRRRLVNRDDIDRLLEAAAGEDVAPTTSPRHRR